LTRSAALRYVDTSRSIDQIVRDEGDYNHETLLYAGRLLAFPHIALLELGLDHGLVKVDPRTKKTETGVDFLSINPKGYVPALEVEPGQVLTEGVAIVGKYRYKLRTTHR
jgi:hypothetical protein